MSQAGGENWLNIASTTASQMAHFILVTISLKTLNRQKKKKSPMNRFVLCYSCLSRCFYLGL